MPIQWKDATPVDALPTLAGRSGEQRDVFVAPEAEAAARAHLATAMVELGGLLIGRAWRGDDGAIAHVRVLRAVAAEESTGTAVSLRMGTSVWQRAQQALEDGDRIIGWYHSHPGLTAFFSDTDRRTQKAFFAHDYSIGWVIDPLFNEQALFIGPDSEPVARGPDPFARARDETGGEGSGGVSGDGSGDNGSRDSGNDPVIRED